MILDRIHVGRIVLYCQICKCPMRHCFITCTYCTDLLNLIYLPILVHINNVIVLCLSKTTLRNIDCLFIY